MLGTALTAVDMQHLGMVVDVVESDELREAALTLGARLCEGVRPVRCGLPRRRSHSPSDRNAGSICARTWPRCWPVTPGEEHRAYVARFSRRTG